MHVDKKIYIVRDNLEYLNTETERQSQNPNRNTYLIVRQNKDGGDLCAHAEFVKSDFWLKNKNSYLYYFFINSSCRGPFLPNYWVRKW